MLIKDSLNTVTVQFHMAKTINNKSNRQISVDTGLKESEISMALNGKRLLGRPKLKQIVDAGYPLYPFVFGKSCLQENDNTSDSNTSTTNPKEKVTA